MNKPFYITTTLPYVNAELHIGHALEFVRADAFARYKKITGHEVFFNTGTDEHGKKILETAEREGKNPKEYADLYFEKFKRTVSALDISEDVHFIRTTDAHHEHAAQAIWRLCRDRGYIYKKNYQAKYCVGCELEKTDSELDENGRCPIHPNREIELLDEENYFFAYSKIAPHLEKLYGDKPELVIPDFRFNEMKAFLSRGLTDFSISRLKSKMSWGVPVPDDDEHVMYVWFDALTNYISTLGWGSDDLSLYEKFWVNGEKIQFCGKDNTRPQSMMWQAILLAAGLPTTDHIVVNGFLNAEGGVKMSKSLGNVVTPEDVLKEYESCAGDLASDVLRYALLRHSNSFEDFSMTAENIREYYNAGLANGLGNLVSRVMKLAEDYLVQSEQQNLLAHIEKDSSFKDVMENRFDFKLAMEIVWIYISNMDESIQKEEPFKVIKQDREKGIKMIKKLVLELLHIANLIEPFMPKTSAIILDLIEQNKKPEKPLFLRI